MVHYLPCSMKLCQSQTSIEFLGSQCGQIYAIFILNFKRTVHEPQVAPKYHLLFCIQYSFYNSPVAFLSLYINTSSYSKIHVWCLLAAHSMFESIPSIHTLHLWSCIRSIQVVTSQPNNHNPRAKLVHNIFILLTVLLIDSDRKLRILLLAG